MAAGKIRESFGDRATPAQLHALGLAHLLSGNIDDAAQELLAASRRQPDNAQYLSDVAVVQLERARRGIRPDDLPRALASADRATRLDPSLREAWFNRAVAITALSLTDQARHAWRQYLDRDSRSAWAAEARAQLAALDQPNGATAWDTIAVQLQGAINLQLAEHALKTNMTESRNFVEQVLFREWAAAVESNRDASGLLANLRVMADAFNRAGDAQYVDSVAAIDRAIAKGSSHVTQLASAHRQFADSSAAFANDRFDDAAKGFQDAQRRLSEFGSPFATRAEIERGGVAHVTGKNDDAIPFLKRGAEVARTRGYGYAEGRSTWFLGLVAFSKSQLGDVRDYYEQARSAFERIGDTEQAAGAHNLLAALFAYLGDDEAAWTHREKALAALRTTRSERFRFMVLASAAASVRRTDPETSLVFQDAVIASAERSGRQLAVVDARNTKAAILNELGRFAEAASDLHATRAMLDRIPNIAARERAEESILATESDYYRRRDPARAVVAAQTAIDRVTKRNDRLRLAQLSLKLAKANIALGHHDAADAALARGIQAFDLERSSLVDGGRLSTLDESWRLFDTAIQLAIHKKDYSRAFELSERSRSRNASGLRRGVANESLSDVEKQVNEDEAIVALDQFDDEIAVWVIRRLDTSVFTRPMARRDAQRLIGQLHDEIRAGSAAPQASSALFNELIRPANVALRGVARMVVVPGETYQGVSFAALWDRSSRRYLVEDVTVRMASSVTAAISGPPAATAVNDVLIVGGPNAGDRARAIAAEYPDATVLSGANATRERVVNAAADRTIVHFVADADRNREYPMLSRLRLAGEPGRPYSTDLLGRDIAATDLSRTRLVVIESNRASESHQGEAFSGLAPAFMAAGVPAVLDTLTNAHSPAIRELMVGFHRQMRQSRSAAQALSRLQRNAIQQNGRR
ncbi:MAG TPA: CHAT domain-containing protein, partial [Vicinamibacterales bacterium]|nr:CHAT domain-containing protein [Vicinamibacterales bacterium]